MVLKDVQARQVQNHMALHLDELMEDTDIYGLGKSKIFPHNLD